MEDNSAIYAVPEICGSPVYTDPVLVRETASARLYRISREGRHFLLKTPGEGGGRLESILKREYEMSLNLNHPHIVHIFSYEYVPSVGAGILMEYVDGRTLAEFIAESPDLKLRRRVWEQLLEAVSYVHRKGLLHNDLKPENILVTRADNDVKLIDFGLADDDAHYLAKTLGCTPGYASPELLRQDETDARSDIYSLGLIMKDLFGKRYSRISSRASAVERESRYTNADHLAAAYSRRNLPLHILLCLILLCALTAPSALSSLPDHNDSSKELARLNRQNDSLKAALDTLQVRYDDVSASFSEMLSERQTRKHFIDSVCNDTELRIAEIYAPLEKKIDEIPLREFLFLEMNKCMRRLPSVWQRFSEITSDQELISSFMSHYTLVQNRCHERYTNRIQQKPYIGIDSMSPEETAFYMSLLGSGEPYRRYGE